MVVIFGITGSHMVPALGLAHWARLIDFRRYSGSRRDQLCNVLLSLARRFLNSKLYSLSCLETKSFH